jgi:hypothetical protein
MEVRHVTETIDVATWLMYLVEIYSDESKKERVVLQLCGATGFDREKVETLLDALFEVLAERLPEH